MLFLNSRPLFMLFSLPKMCFLLPWPGYASSMSICFIWKVFPEPDVWVRIFIIEIWFTYNAILVSGDTLSSAHHNKCSHHLLLNNISIISLIIFPVWYFSSLWLIYFLIRGLYLSIPFIYFSHPPIPRLATTGFWSVFKSLFFCFFLFVLFLKFHMSEIIRYLSFCLGYFTQHDIL